MDLKGRSCDLIWGNIEAFTGGVGETEKNHELPC
jgi:hypothetical protein